MTRIYLDNAATTWPKPEAVYEAVDRYQRHLGASPARGVYAEALEADRVIDSARAAVAELLDAEGPARIVFTLNGTDSLNLAIHGVLSGGGHVVTSAADHNSVLRPLRWLEDRGRIDATRVDCDADGLVDPDDVRRAIRPDTRLVALIHASNVTGILQPVAEVGRIAREHGALFLVDAAQSLGHVPISVRAMRIDLLAAPGHKGLLGPLGTGLLYVRPGVEQLMGPLRQGGTGTHSDEDRQPDEMPHKYEPGNHNAAGIAGLLAAVRFLEDRTLASIRRHEMDLTERLVEGFCGISGVTLFGPRDPRDRVGVVSIRVAGLSPGHVAALLEAGHRIQVRAGIHCAPRMHAALGTLDHGGTVRFSLGPFNTSEHVDAAIEAVRGIAQRRVEEASTLSSRPSLT